MCKCTEKQDLNRMIDLASRLAGQLQENTVVYKTFNGYNFCTQNHAIYNIDHENIIKVIEFKK